MKLSSACVVALASVATASAGSEPTCLVPAFGDHDPAGNGELTGDAQGCRPDQDTQSSAELWNQEGGSYFANNGVNLFYTIEGSGDPVILIHGLACDQSDWIFQIPFLLSHGFQVITIDQRGHGHSSAPEPAIYSSGSPYSYDPLTLSDDIAALLKALEVGNTTIRGAAIAFGHSLGGVVASELAFRNPELVKALVLVDSAHYNSVTQARAVVAMLKNNSASTASEVWASIFDGMESSVVGRPPWMRVWRIHKIWSMRGHLATAIFEQLFEYLGQWTSNIEYRRERQGVPKLAIVAEQSSADFENEVGLADEDRVEVLDGGHWHFQTNATRFNSLVEEWFMSRGYIQR